MKRKENKMKDIYTDIISEGTTSLIDDYIDETPNPVAVAEDEITTMVGLFPEMLKILKDAKGVVSLTSPSMADRIKNIIAKAEGK